MSSTASPSRPVSPTPTISAANSKDSTAARRSISDGNTRHCKCDRKGNDCRKAYTRSLKVVEDWHKENTMPVTKHMLLVLALVSVRLYCEEAKTPDQLEASAALELGN